MRPQKKPKAPLPVLNEALMRNIATSVLCLFEGAHNASSKKPKAPLPVLNEALMRNIATSVICLFEGAHRCVLKNGLRTLELY